MASKYDPLGAYLATRQTREVPMSFAEIETVIGAPLPPKAINHPAWWSNNTSNNTMTRVWLDAGFRTERVDIGSRRLVFRRVGSPPAPPAAPRHGQPPRPSAPSGLLERIKTALGGTVHVAPNVSLTSPTGEAWDADQD
jgi:hypothetical protein